MLFLKSLNLSQETRTLANLKALMHEYEYDMEGFHQFIASLDSKDPKVLLFGLCGISAALGNFWHFRSSC